MTARLIKGIQSGFYPVQQGVSSGKRLPSLFSTTDEAYHANLRRSVNNAFSMSQLVQYEPGVTECVEVFLDQTEKLFAKEGKVCDFAEWLQYFAFDVSSKLPGFIHDRADRLFRSLGTSLIANATASSRETRTWMAWSTILGICSHMWPQ
jgi:cytochrome P450